MIRFPDPSMSRNQDISWKFLTSNSGLSVGPKIFEWCEVLVHDNIDKNNNGLERLTKTINWWFSLECLNIFIEG